MSNASVKTENGLLSSPTPKSRVSERGLVSDSIATGVFFALVLTVGQRIIGFVRGLLFCSLMTEQELGQWSMTWSYLMLLAPLAVLGLPGCFGKFSEYYRQRGQLRSFVLRITWFTFFATGALAVGIFLFPGYFSYLFFRDDQQVGLVRFLAIGILFVSASNFLTTLMESLRQVKTVTWMRFVTGMSFATVGTGLIYCWEDGAAAATIGFSISCLLGLIPAWLVLRRNPETFVDTGESLSYRDLMIRLAPFALWLWFSDLFHNLFEVADRYMLIHWSSMPAEAAQGAVGQYHSGRVVPLLFVSVAGVLSGVLLPYLSKAWEAGESDKAKQLMRWSIKLVALGFTLGGVGVLIISQPLFQHVFQGRYNDGLAVLPLTMVYCIWIAIFFVAQLYLWVAEKGKLVVVSLAAGLAVNLGLNTLLIPRIGLEGAVIATAFGNAVAMVGIILLNHKIGCRADFKIWFASLLPLCLLLPVTIAIAAGTIALIGCVFTGILFDQDEKSQIRSVVDEKLGRFNR